MSRPHRVAVLGAGFIGQAHIIALRQIPSVEVSLLVDHQADRAAQKAAYWGVPEAGDEWRRAFADPEIDVVHDCLPNHLHAEVLAAAIESGRPLFAEKPLTMTWSEAESIRDLATRRKVPPIGVNFNYRHYPMVREMRRQIAAGVVGRPFMVMGQYLQDWMLADAGGPNWRAEPERGGPSRALWDIGSHVLDLSAFVLGQRIARVQARAGRKATAETPPRPQRPSAGLDDDFTTLWFETAAGVMGTAVVSQVHGGHKNDLRLEVAGSAGSMGWQQEHPDTLWLGEASPSSHVVSRTVPWDFRAGSRTPYPPGHVMGWPDSLKASVEAFYAALDGETRDGQDGQDGRALLEDGLRSMALLDTAVRSAVEERMLDVPMW